MEDKNPCPSCIKQLAASFDDDIEGMAAAVHDAYLDTCQRLGWSVRPDNKVSYEKLTEDSKELDRATARAVVKRLLGRGDEKSG